MNTKLVPYSSGPAWMVPVGRVLFALIFVTSAPNLFTYTTVEMVAGHGVPYAPILVPIAGLLALLGGLSIAFGYKTRVGASLLVLFLVPVTIFMHNFWDVYDPGLRQMQGINFMKNLALLGGAFAFAFFGAGPMSVDAPKGLTESKPVSLPHHSDRKAA